MTFQLPTIRSLLIEAERRLNGSDTGRLDAEVLLCHVLATDRARLYSAKDNVVSDGVQVRYRELISKRASGVPVAYLTGQREFWSLPLEVNDHTLIPRPETEHLVETALELIRTEDLRRIADLGTGSGAIALAIRSERPGCDVVATDISEAALALAQDNAARLDISGIDFRLGDWCEALAGETFDLIVSNPPYVADNDPYLHQGDLRFEPRLALAAGTDGLDAIRRILAGVRACLRKRGWLALEHGFDQKERLWNLLENHGFQPLKTVRDYGGKERVTVAKLG